MNNIRNTIHQERERPESPGRPRSGWIFSYVWSELFSSGRWPYSLLCMCTIALAITYILLAGYYATITHLHNKKTVESMGTKIIVNCPDIRNPSLMFTDEKIEEEFRKDTRIVSPYPRIELGIKLSIAQEEPVVVYAEGCIPDSPVTYERNMYSGRGLSSLKARETVLSEALYRKLFGLGKPSGEETVKLSISRTVNRVKQYNNFRLRVVGILERGHWSRVYMPFRFLEYLDMWCDNSIDNVPSESGDVSSVMPGLAYKSGTLFVPENVTEEELEGECRHWNIEIREEGRPFYEVICEDEKVCLRVSHKNGKLIYEPGIRQISDSLKAKTIVEPSRLERLELFFGRFTDEARVVALMPEDERISGIGFGSGMKLSDIIGSGHAAVSESYAKRLRLKGRNKRCPSMLSNGTSLVSNTLSIKGTVPDNILTDEWDIMCGIEELALLMNRLKVEYMCLVSTSDKYMIPRLQKKYGNENMHVSSRDIAEILYFRTIEEKKSRQSTKSRKLLSFEESIKYIASLEPGNMEKINAVPALPGYQEIFAGNVGMRYTSYTVCMLFIPDDFISEILVRQNISVVPKKARPMIAVISAKDRLAGIAVSRAGIWAKEKGISLACTVSGDLTCFMLPASLKDKICPDAVKVGFIGEAKPAGYTHPPHLLKNIKEFQKTKFSHRSYLFALPGNKEDILKGVYSFEKPSLKIAEVLQLPDISRGVMFAVARPEEIGRLPYGWARYYANNRVIAGPGSLKSGLRLGSETTTAIEMLRDGEFPERLVLLPPDRICNNRNLIDKRDLGFSSIDIVCDAIAFGYTLNSLKEIDWAETDFTSNIEFRGLTCYEFTDNERNDSGEMRKDLINMLKTRYPTFVNVSPNISLHAKPSQDNDFLKKFEVLGSFPEDVRRFQVQFREGNWLKPDKNGIILPAEVLAEFGGHEELIGKQLVLNFEKEIKRSFAEPELSIPFRIDGIVSGNRGYIPLNLAKHLSLWQSNKISYLESGNRFIVPVEIYKITGYSQCNLFVKDISMLKSVVNELQARGYTTYDTLGKQEELRRIWHALIFMVFLLMFGTTVNGITNVSVITLMNNEKHLHEIGNLKAWGAGSDVIRDMFIYQSLILGIGAYVLAVVFSILIEPVIKPTLQKAFSSIPFEGMATFPIYSFKMWMVYALAFLVSVGCCMLSLVIAYLRVRKLSVVDIFRHQYY